MNCIELLRIVTRFKTSGDERFKTSGDERFKTSGDEWFKTSGDERFKTIGDGHTNHYTTEGYMVFWVIFISKMQRFCV